MGETLGALLGDLVRADAVYKKIVGMQMLVEGLAMGAFATLHVRAHDPLLRSLCQLSMTDEAFHHKFGKIWAQITMPRVDEAERHAVEDWACECFQPPAVQPGERPSRSARSTRSSVSTGSGCAAP